MRTRKPTIVDEAWTRWGWIVESVARRHGVSVDGLLGRARTAPLAAARHDLMCCLWASGVAYAEIGRLLGRDHTTVMHGVRRAL
jgi:chromosomal replication initiation ATPase DnaA